MSENDELENQQDNSQPHKEITANSKVTAVPIIDVHTSFFTHFLFHGEVGDRKRSDD